MQEIAIRYAKVIDNLSQLRILSKYDNTHPEIFLHNKSAYVFGLTVNCKIDFLDRKFENVVKVPFNASFESSDDIEDSRLSCRIAKVNERCRTYCDTLFYINKYELLNFMNANYNSIAKLNKIKLTIELNDGVILKFTPKKKSVSVFPCEFKIDTTSQLCPNFRIESGQISINTLSLYQVLSNDLLGKNVRIEINTRKGFLRASCITEEINSKFVIDKIQE